MIDFSLGAGAVLGTLAAIVGLIAAVDAGWWFTKRPPFVSRYGVSRRR